MAQYSNNSIAEKESDYPSFLHIGSKKKDIEYGYYHDYTLFDKKNIQPHFPFGFGLSYTTFEITNSVCQINDNIITVSADVRNTGNRDGDEVIQVYVSSENTKEDRPVKLLKGFKRVSISAGKTMNVSVDGC